MEGKHGTTEQTCGFVLAAAVPIQYNAIMNIIYANGIILTGEYDQHVNARWLCAPIHTFASLFSNCTLSFFTFIVMPSFNIRIRIHNFDFVFFLFLFFLFLFELHRSSEYVRFEMCVRI